MKKLTILIIVLIFSNCYANTEENNCRDIMINLQSCSKYQCSYFANAKDYIEYKILGKDDNNLCKYSEQYNNHVMTCNYSHDGVKAQLKQLSSIFARDISSLDTHELENIQAKECIFSSQESSKPNKANYELLEKISKDEKELESIFFNAELVYRLNSAIGQFSKKHMKEDLIFTSNKIQLNSILYLSPHIWKIWVNGKLFQNNKNLIVSHITPEYVEFTLIPGEDTDKEMQKSDITFILYPNQIWDRDSISVNN